MLSRTAALAAALAASSLIAGGLADATTTSAATDQLSTDGAGRVIAVEPAAPVAAPHGASAATAAQANVTRLAKQFGLSVGELVLSDVRPVPGGSVARLQQKINGVPVFGAQVVQDLDGSGALLAAVGKTTQRSAGAFPAQDAAARAKAGESAVAAVAAKNSAAKALRADAAQNYWYDASLGTDGAPATAVPAYFVPVHGADPEDKWTVVVGADTNQVLTVWGETRQAANRVVCDANRKVVDLDTATEADIRCGAGHAFGVTRGEGQAAVATTDVNKVYDYFGAAQSFYSKYAGYDLTASIGANYGDGKGKALRGTVRMCEISTGRDGVRRQQCPWANAFWDGEQMAFGEGVTTMDITGHELTHGVTQHTSALAGGYAQAINEGMSDVFGKFIAIKANDPNAAGANRWLLGAGSSLGQVRDMRNPANSGEGPSPDRVNGQYWAGPDGDEHIDAGVVGKTDYLITDGDTFNGQTVRGIGEDKSIALWWKVENLLRSTATFKDLGNALNTACASNVRTKVAGTTADDCAQVAKAVKATQLNQNA
ncbi:M4 family metallopeptidase [Kutzneria sp. CA-103260]|uniref:M4 family metallopeptidase n=1 Tax=Kutzneria sp. CA-103260 TaxID=2802641 RepID=UPI001BAD1523|nr:M4 family metallopeptidase [Kutzneria sp. CA-103260]QUQ63899.1 Zinc metalloproteinase [Kutzneria sp. CA-103260]